MRTRPSMPHCVRILVLFVVASLLPASTFAAGPVEKVIHSFDISDGEFPEGGLVADAAGNLYVTGVIGGPFKCTCGTVVELSPPTTAGGDWTETVIYSFRGDIDGYNPYGTLTFDERGNLYGTTAGGAGGVFELSPPATSGAAWTETTLWTFDQDGTGGNHPLGKVVIDGDGNLYGTTQQGGSHAGGVVFELINPKTLGGTWEERVLHSFGAFAADGIHPAPSLLLRGGDLYGTTTEGGANSDGTVFQLLRKPGLWTENILHNFTGNDGSYPYGQLIVDDAGNIYGSATFGGEVGCQCGAVYELSPPAIAGDPWQEVTLYSFTGKADGRNIYGGLWRNKLGELYGTGQQGSHRTDGSIFELKPPTAAGESWTFVFLHDFGNYVGDGISPYSGLTFSNGALYGTTYGGGAIGAGTVFSIVP
jgi:uncharacterized repeat protein (TIGR03803 family)